jgi:hypothetical protein
MKITRHVMAVALLLSGAATAQEGAWIADTSVGCQVWNPHPQPNETIWWSGACTNGLAQGRGSAQWFRNNLVFETDQGEWQAGRQQGYGTQVWPTGRYEGELADGEPNGRGVLVLPGARYDGEFRKGKPHGVGTLTRGSETFRGTWNEGCFREGTRKTALGVPSSACPG